MRFQILKTSDRHDWDNAPAPVPHAKRCIRDRTGQYGFTFQNVWWEIEVEDLNELLKFAESLSKENENPRFEVVLQSAGNPYDEDQPKYALEIVDDYRD